MDRRTLIRSLGPAATLGFAGCLIGGGSEGTAPLTGTFDQRVEPDHWGATVDDVSQVAFGDAIDVRSVSATTVDGDRTYQSTVARMSSDGTEQWRDTSESASEGLCTGGGSVYHFRSENQSEDHMTRLAAHDAQSGRLEWTRPAEPTPSFLEATKEAVYFGITSDDPSGGRPVTAYEKEGGDQLWRRTTRMPLEGVVTETYCLVQGYPNYVIVLDAATGTKRWERDVGARIEETRIFGDTLYLASEAGLTAYSLPDGTVNWERDITGTMAVADPDAAEVSSIYIGGRDGSIYSLNAADGSTNWSKSPTAVGDQGYGARIEHAGDRLVAQKGRTLYGFHSSDGTEQWRQVPPAGFDVSSPVLIDDTVFLLDAPTDTELKVKTFDLATGDRRWQYPIELVTPLEDGFPRYGVSGDFLVGWRRSGTFFGVRDVPV